ncbi:MAG: hypothetical protein ACRDN0_00575 [Trebonia sp.]
MIAADQVERGRQCVAECRRHRAAREVRDDDPGHRGEHGHGLVIVPADHRQDLIPVQPAGVLGEARQQVVARLAASREEADQPGEAGIRDHFAIRGLDGELADRGTGPEFHGQPGVADGLVLRRAHAANDAEAEHQVQQAQHADEDHRGGKIGHR